MNNFFMNPNQQGVINLQPGLSLIPGYFLVSCPVVYSSDLQPVNQISGDLSLNDYCLCEMNDQASPIQASETPLEKENEEDFTVVEDEKFKEPQKLGEKKRRCFKTEQDNDVLQPFKFKYIYTGTSRYRKKIIQCMYEGCDKKFGKSWNFRDHALMHEGHKPYKCSI